MKFYREAVVQIRIRNEDLTFKGTITLSGLRVSFSITKSLASSTNTAVIKIWNLSQSNRNLINTYGDQVTLFAGYSSNSNPSSGLNPNSKASEILFIGDTTSVSHLFEQPEIITTLECGDGERFINELRVSISTSSNTSARDIIRQVAEQMQLPIAEFAESNDLVYRQGYKNVTMGKDVLTSVCNYLNLQWSIQNNALQVIPIDGTIVQPAIQVNENTGMQGIPQRYTYRSLDLYRSISAPNTGYKVRMALNPFIIPGAKIVLKSNRLNIEGPYRVENVYHDGDTYGPVWSSQIQCTEIQGST